MIFLESTVSLNLRLTADVILDTVASVVDMSSSALPSEKVLVSVVNTSGTNEIIPAPASGVKRVIKSLTVTNNDSITGNLAVKAIESSGPSEFFVRHFMDLRPGETLSYEDGKGWEILSATDTNAYSGRLVAFNKVGTAADTVGYHYCHSKDSGFPGAWAPGSPGLAGRTTDGTASGDAGCLVIPNPATGGNYLTAFELAPTISQFFQLIDILWVNSGIVVTTTTGQTIGSGTLPARDANGSTNGEGCIIGLLFTAAATNAAVINNSTVTYTNSGGVGSRTATLLNSVGAQIPVTPTIGTVVWFQLQAGDKGVRSIQTVTLNTSLVTGSVSLLIARILATYSAPVANIGSGAFRPMDPGIRIFNNTCAVLCYTAASTTATTVIGSVTVQERAL